MIAERYTSGRLRPWRNEDMKARAEEELHTLLPLALSELRWLLMDRDTPPKVRKEAIELVLERVYNQGTEKPAGE